LTVFAELMGGTTAAEGTGMPTRIAALLVAIAACHSDEPEVCQIESAPVPITVPLSMPISAPIVAASPAQTAEVRGVTAQVARADEGIAMTVGFELRVPEARGMVVVHARCAVDRDWYDGSSTVLLERVGTGEHAMAQQLVVGRQYRLGVLPGACQLMIEQSGVKRRTLALACWNGQRVVDGRCAPLGIDTGVSVASMQVRKHRDLMTVDIEAEMARALPDAYLAIEATCSGQTDRGRFSLRSAHPNVRFMDHAYVGGRGDCVLRVEVTDLYDMSREPVGCWITDGAGTRPAACPPTPEA
jgi:hypothetical protein